MIVRDTWAMLARWFIHLRRDPMSLSMGLIQPLFFFLFGGVFKGVMGSDTSLLGGVDYLSFYTSGVLAFTMLTNAILGGIPLVFDLETGFMDKILASPISRTSIITSRFLYVLFYSLLQTLVVLGVGFALGVRIHGDAGLPLALAGIVGFGALLTAGITAVSLAFAFLAPHHSVFFSITGFLTTPMLVLSSAFVPLDRIPQGWMNFVATWNPLTHAIEPIRALVCGTQTNFALHAGYLAIFDVICFAFAVRIIRRRLD